MTRSTEKFKNYPRAHRSTDLAYSFPSTIPIYMIYASIEARENSDRAFVYVCVFRIWTLRRKPIRLRARKKSAEATFKHVTAVFLLLSVTTMRYDEEIVIRFRKGKCTFDATGRDDRNLIRIIWYINLENGDKRTNHFEARDLEGAVFGDFSAIRLHRCHSNLNVFYSSQCWESQCRSNRRHSPLQVYLRFESYFYHIRKTFSQSVNLHSYATVCTCHRVLHRLNYIAREIFFDEGNYLIN